MAHVKFIAGKPNERFMLRPKALRGEHIPTLWAIAIFGVAAVVSVGVLANANAVRLAPAVTRVAMTQPFISASAQAPEPAPMSVAPQSVQASISAPVVTEYACSSNANNPSQVSVTVQGKAVAVPPGDSHMVLHDGNTTTTIGTQCQSSTTSSSLTSQSTNTSSVSVTVDETTNEGGAQ